MQSRCLAQRRRGAEGKPSEMRYALSPLSTYKTPILRATQYVIMWNSVDHALPSTIHPNTAQLSHDLTR